MATYLLTWNPSRWPWTDQTQWIERLQRTGVLRESWSCGNNRSIVAGDRVFLLRLGESPKGILGSGVVSRPVYEGAHWNTEEHAADKVTRYVDVNFDYLAQKPVISIEDLSRPPFSSMNWLPQGAGVRISDEIVAALEQLWAQRTGAGASAGPDEVDEGGGYLEGAQRTVVVNAFERDPAARRACIEHYGASCFVCGFDFGSRYGDFARGYIHVHHVVPLSEIGSEYRVDPVQDLRPLCPNCHAAIHLAKPLRTPEELKKLIAD